MTYRPHAAPLFPFPFPLTPFALQVKSVDGKSNLLLFLIEKLRHGAPDVIRIVDSMSASTMASAESFHELEKAVAYIAERTQKMQRLVYMCAVWCGVMGV